MSWQKCDNDKTCSLAVPASVDYCIDLLHVWVGLSLFWLQLPPDFTILLLVLVVRSRYQTHRRFDRAAQLELRIDPNGLFSVNEHSRRSSGDTVVEEQVRESRTPPIYIAGKLNNEPECVVTQRQGTEGTEMRQQYTCCRSVRVPGCIRLTLVSGSSKPLEILVFYRYYQRQFYRRLLRQLALM